MGSMTGKTALVTGATSGIGKAIAVGLAREGAHVVLLARNTERAARAVADIRAHVPQASVEVIACDLASQLSIRDAAAEFLSRHDRLHVLVNCAGVFLKERQTTPEGIERTFATNYLAYFLLTNLLLDALRHAAPSRVVNVASKTTGTRIDLDDLNAEKRPYSYMRATPPTMVARQMFTAELAERLKGSGVVVNTLHPGLTAGTRLLDETRGLFRILTNLVGAPPERAADTALWLATAPEAGAFTGKMFENRREIRLAPQAKDGTARKRLWDESARLTKLA